MSDSCGCCTGVGALTPEPTVNRPGLSAIAYRVGTHSSFLATMHARLASLLISEFSGQYDALGQPTYKQVAPLSGLTTRDSSDFSIALLDAWATVADVLTFYQERIANEGYLRTATERQSVVELARLISYKPRPGVAASVYLAYTLEKDSAATLDVGSRAQSIPGPGEHPESFEITDPLEARTGWNTLGPRLNQPQSLPDSMSNGHRIYLDGIATKLKAGDLLLTGGGPQNVYRVRTVSPDPPASRTVVTVDTWTGAPETATVSALSGTLRTPQDIITSYTAVLTPLPATDIPAKHALNALNALNTSISSTAAAPALESALQTALQAVNDALSLSEVAASTTATLSQLNDDLTRLVQVKTPQEITAAYLNLLNPIPPTDLLATKARDSLNSLQTAINQTTADPDLENAAQVAFQLVDDALSLVDSSTAAPVTITVLELLQNDLGRSILQRPQPPDGRSRLDELKNLLLTKYSDEALRASATAADAQTLAQALLALGALRTAFQANDQATATDPWAFAFQIQLAIETLRVVSPKVPSSSTSSLGTLIEAIRADLGGIVQGLPIGAIQGNDTSGALNAIRLFYRSPASNPPRGVSDAGTIADIAEVRAALAELAQFPPLSSIKDLADRVRRVLDDHLVDTIDLPVPDATASAWLAAAIAALDELDVSLRFGPIRDAIRAIAERYQDLNGAGYPRGESALADRVFDLLDAWMTNLNQAHNDEEALAALMGVVTQIRSELKVAQAGGYPRLAPWLAGLVADLDDAASARRSAAPPGPAPTPVTFGALQIPPDPAHLFGQLTAPPSVPPPDSLKLARNLREVFAIRTNGDSHYQFADISTQLLINVDPRLKASLYPALSNLDVNPAVSSSTVKALRVKAAPFGANAPKKPIVEDGATVGSEEWPLAEAEIRIDLQSIPPNLSAPGNFACTITLTRNGKSQSCPKFLPTDGAVVNVGSVVVLVSLVPIAPPPMSPTTVIFQFFETSPTQHDAFETVTIMLTNNNSELFVRLGDDPGFTVNANNPRIREAVFRHETEIIYSPPRTTGPQAGAGADLTVREVIPLALAAENWNVLALDAVYDQILPESWVVIERADKEGAQALQVRRVTGVTTVARADYGITAKITQLTLDSNWLDDTDTDLSSFRNAAVHAQSEPLKLAEAPYDADVAGGTIELDGLYDGLKSGRWVIVSGERTDIPATGGVKASELAMIASIKQDVASGVPGDKLHSFLVLSERLAYHYKRSNVTIFGNVAKATHGENRNEILGGGSGGTALQQFSLRQSPLTYVSSPNPSGIDSTLAVRVNDILWKEQDTLAGLGPNDRAFVTQTDEDDVTTVIFGNGQEGARLPTGQENVRATYRYGIGQAGNVKADQISLLVTRQLGVKSVTNPLPALGGADREGIDQARRNAPLAVTALDRLVSVQDFEDFARTFAGIGKSSAKRFARNGSEFVHLTVAGVDDISLDDRSDVYRNLKRALATSGDPFLPFMISRRELVTVVVSAEIRIFPEYLWEKVAQSVRDALTDAFGFSRRELGQPLYLSEVYAIAQAVEGVDFVNVTAFGGIPELGEDRSIITFDDIRQRIEGPCGIANVPPAQYVAAQLARDATDGSILPAQIALLLPAVPDTLILKEVT